jgi:hypothetical protein
VAFYTKVQEKIGFGTLQARKDLGSPLVPVWKGSILHLTDLKRCVQASSLKSAKRRKYDKDYSSEDMFFPIVKGFREEGSLNCKTDSPHRKDLGMYEDPSCENFSKEQAWQMKDMRMGCNEKSKHPFEYWLLKEHI